MHYKKTRNKNALLLCRILLKSQLEFVNNFKITTVFQKILSKSGGNWESELTFDSNSVRAIK